MPGLTRRWWDRWLARRDRLLTSPRFRDWAAAFPLTRPIARRRTRELFDLCAGFVYSQVLYSAVQLRLFEHLRRGPRTIADLADAIELTPAATERLLRAAAALQLVELRGADRYGLGALGAALVDNPGLTAMIEHHRVLYGDLSDPVRLLRDPTADTALSHYWAYGRDSGPEEVAAYSDLMASSQAMIAAQLLQSYPLDRFRCLLDVGGGSGAFIAAVAAQVPGLQFQLFDLPAVVERARKNLAARGIGARVAISGGDFFKDALPTGADIVTLVRVLHDHDDAQVISLLRAVHAAMPAAGVLLIVEPLAETRGAQRMGDAYFGFYLLAMRRGRPRTPSELALLLQAGGFAQMRQVATPITLLTSVLEARPMVRRTSENA